ncbi:MULTISPECIES: hypothetical protein [Actinoalloteichus]|uniref:Uncharacterized protein n=1 Tax=Actinoalloteichus fjordicus TaxID=1612552 RepID=A0AAC9LEJ9_9PSEU|nr:MULTISPECIES: hypothetical protein [Actinoalloteichus]APU16393.1 hypothetical protein UA74_21855 [Actinoalloteichus fjordicus]APU22451.1 hypothetical protein UA75_22325 [Actinoalloteichus sp. GBA129-24]
MIAIIAAVLFGLALILDIAGASLGLVSSGLLTTAGLLCLALHLGGVGSNRRARRR